MTVTTALEILAVDWPDIRAPNYPRMFKMGELHGVYQSFRERHDGQLDVLAVEVKRAYYRRARQIRTDLEENHSEACLLNDAYSFLCRALGQRGIEVN